MTYAGFQKMMVRQAIEEQPAPSCCQLVANAWPKYSAEQTEILALSLARFTQNMRDMQERVDGAQDKTC